MAANEIPGYQCKLLNRVEVAEGTMAFYFGKPSRFDFKPGQSADLTLSNPPETDSGGNTRTLCSFALGAELVTVPSKVLEEWAATGFPMPDRNFRYRGVDASGKPLKATPYTESSI